MSSITITLQSSLLQVSIDLELPDEVTLHNLLPDLVRALKLPSVDNTGRPIAYQIIHQARNRSLHGDDTLQGTGIVTGDVLSLVSTSLPAGAVPPGWSSNTQGNSALLRCASGKVIALDNYGKPELTVGRYDVRTGKSPDIDLSKEPAGDTVSRSHALLRKQGSQWTLMPLSARNPTQVGGTRLAPQQPHLLNSGDVIALGAVKLTFT
jgi:uncharacterized ubiquitin-like protein YukD